MNTTIRNRLSGRLGLLLSLAIFAAATTGCVTTSAWAQTYFPPTNAPDNWRSLIPGPNMEPSQGEKDTIANTVGLDWDQLEVAYLYSRGFNPGAEVLMIKDGWVVWAWTGGNNFLQETSGASMTKSATALAYAHLFDQNPAIGPAGSSWGWIPEFIVSKWRIRISPRVGSPATQAAPLDK